MTARLIPEASLNPAQATGDGGLHISSDTDLPKRIEYALSAFVKATDLAYVPAMRGSSEKSTIAS